MTVSRRAIPFAKIHIFSDGALKTTRTRDFDELITRRLLKYDNVDELYSKIECESAINDLKIPVLLLSSKDDPVIR